MVALWSIKDMIAGVVASQNMLGAVANPSILSSYCYTDGFTYEAHFIVRNNDTETVTIYAEINDNTPDISQGTIVSGGSTSDIVVTGLLANYIIYAQGTATGRTSSSVVSLSVNVSTCILA